MATRLDGLLRWYREEAVRAVSEEPFGREPTLAIDTALQRAEIVADALRTLRRTNPNRPLLAEALLLKLART
jgi:hypothetical protein